MKTEIMHSATHHFLRLAFAAALVAALTSCAAVEPQPVSIKAPAPAFLADRFGDRPEIIEANEIFRLTSAQARGFLDHFHDPAWANMPAHRRVYHYLEAITADFSFQGDTLGAAEALERGSGNCLSLAILTTALANLAGVEIDYQLMDSSPVFESQGQVIYKGVHARSILYDPSWQPQEGVLTMRRPGIRVDYFPSGTERFIGNLPRNEFVAMYYSNLAADALADGELSEAFWLLRESLDHAPDNAAAINMMAVVYRRAGDERTAEAVYRYGIANVPDRVSLLRNYRILLTQQGRTEEAEAIGAELDRLADPNPFDWIHAAQQAHEEGHYSEAISLYRKAVAIAPYLHESYFGMAKSHLGLGNRQRAEAELANAMERAHRASTRSLYEAKLSVLQDL